MARIYDGKEYVFSAHAEVVPVKPLPPLMTPCILRARGGSSRMAVPAMVPLTYSPRTRR